MQMSRRWNIILLIPDITASCLSTVIKAADLLLIYVWLFDTQQRSVLYRLAGFDLRTVVPLRQPWKWETLETDTTNCTMTWLSPCTVYCVSRCQLSPTAFAVRASRLQQLRGIELLSILLSMSVFVCRRNRLTADVTCSDAGNPRCAAVTPNTFPSHRASEP